MSYVITLIVSILHPCPVMFGDFFIHVVRQKRIIMTKKGRKIESIELFFSIERVKSKLTV